MMSLTDWRTLTGNHEIHSWDRYRLGMFVNFYVIPRLTSGTFEVMAYTKTTRSTPIQSFNTLEEAEALVLKLKLLQP